MKFFGTWVLSSLSLFVLGSLADYGRGNQVDQKPIIATPNPFHPSEHPMTPAAPKPAARETLASYLTTASTAYCSKTSAVVLATFGVYADDVTRTVPINNKTIATSVEILSSPLRTAWVSRFVFYPGPSEYHGPRKSDCVKSATAGAGLGFKNNPVSSRSNQPLVRPFCHGDTSLPLTLPMPTRVRSQEAWTTKVTLEESYGGFYCGERYGTKTVDECMRQYTTPLNKVWKIVDMPAGLETHLATSTVLHAPHWGYSDGNDRDAVTHGECYDEQSCLFHCRTRESWFHRHKFQLLAFLIPALILGALVAFVSICLKRHSKRNSRQVGDKEIAPQSTDATPGSRDPMFRGRYGKPEMTNEKMASAVPPASGAIDTPSAASFQKSPAERNAGINPTASVVSSSSNPGETISNRPENNNNAMNTSTPGVESAGSNPPSRVSSATLTNPKVPEDDEVSTLNLSNSNADPGRQVRYATGSEVAENGDGHAVLRRQSEH